MSAIAGIIQLHADEEIIVSLLASMRRRGPDGEGSFSVPGITLLHTALADVPQPLVLEYENERFVFSSSASLYNKEELRSQLLALDHRFVGNSDGEVLLHAYAQWKEGCLEKCNGVFTFAVWEMNAGKLFLARDRMGVKPLFYMEHQGGLLFSSEMKTILTYPGVQAKLDTAGAAEIILLGPGRIPGSGVFYGMKELEPGCCCVYANGKLQVKRYWKLWDGEHTDSFEKTVENVRWMLEDAVLRQTDVDEPLGTFLSGGIDSSIVSALAAGSLKQKGCKLHSFSLDYDQNHRYFTPGKFQPNADPEYILIMENFISGVPHHTVLNSEDLVENIYDATIARDLPGMADVDSSLLAFCGQIRPHVKVALSGECADEIFGGYPWYRDPEIRNGQGFPWSQTLPQRIGLMQPWLMEKLDPNDFVQSLYADTVRKSDILPGINPTDRRMKEMMNLNIRWFMQTLLDRNDRMSMYHGLQVRVPFCDYRIAEYLYKVPWYMKDYEGMEKGLLRQAVKGLLPDSIRLRKKSPFPKTHDPKYEKIATKLLSNILRDKNAPIFALLRHDGLKHMVKQEFPWPWYGQLMRRPQTMMYMVQLNYWLEHYNVSII